MRKILLVLLVLVMSLATLTACGGEETERTAIAPSVAEETYLLDFTLYNHSNAAITDIRISESTDESYGENLLEEGFVLPDGYYCEVPFNYTAPAGTLFDMYTNDEDGDSYHYMDIPLTEITELHLYVEWYADGTYNNTYEYK